MRIALALVLLGTAAARAANPCPDEPGLNGLACRVDALAERGGADVAAVQSLLAHATGDCAAGHTASARRELRGMRRPLGQVGDDADVALTDALRRATLARLERHPCPELVEVLSPRWQERVDGDSLFVLVRLAADADPATLTMQLGAGPVSAPDPGDVSATQGWLRMACTPAGARQLRVVVRSRDGERQDVEQIPVTCGGGSVLGAEIESLVLDDYVPERLRVVPVRPLRSGATYALVA